MREIIINSEKDTERFGLELAETLRPGDVLALVGDLGAGKTTLTKYIAKGLGVTEMVTSPTFTIVNEYLSGRIPLYHFDAYRLGDVHGACSGEGASENESENDAAPLDDYSVSDEVFETGIEEYFYKDGICVVEWAELIVDILPPDVKCIFMEYVSGDEEQNTKRLYKCTF